MKILEKLSSGLERLDGQSAMPLLDHLDELRKRLIHSLLAIAVCFGAVYPFADRLLDFLMRPVLEALKLLKIPESMMPALHFSGLIEPFFIHLKLAFYGAFFAASPFIFFQLWQFIAPGLYRREKATLGILAFFSFLMFGGGMAFAYYLVFPLGFQFFLSYARPGLSPILMISDYLTLITRLLFAFGVIFQMPLVLVLLSVAGVIHYRQIAGFWRYAVIIIAIVSAAMTPGPDVGSMMMMMVPMLILYGLSIVLAAIFGRKPAKNMSNDR